MIAAPGQLDSRHVAHQVNGETTFRKPNRSRKARRETPLKSHLVDSQLVERIGRGIMSFTGNERRDISGEEEDARVSNRQVVPTLNWIKAASARTPLASTAPS
jgi:hypothetical protein